MRLVEKRSHRMPPYFITTTTELLRIWPRKQATGSTTAIMMGLLRTLPRKAGVTLGSWSTWATFGDYDADGRLDLFVAGYVHYDIEHPPAPHSAAVTVHLLSISWHERDVRSSGTRRRTRSPVSQQ